MNDEQSKVVAWHFHWKFWNPKTDLIGETVYFGEWAEMSGDCPDQSYDQVIVKRAMGLFR